jgi:hypothetical protein
MTARDANNADILSRRARALGPTYSADTKQ